jgi:class 3 adenylate cyclase
MPADDAATAELTAEELAGLAGADVGRIERLVDLGILQPSPLGTFSSGDVHRIRLIETFESSGVPLDALVAGAATGRIDWTDYHKFHADPGRPSSRSYATFGADVDPSGTRMPRLFAALGIAEPGATSHLSLDDEAFLESWLSTIDGTTDPSIAIRAVRLFAESARRSTEGALEAYEQAASRLGPDPASVSLEAYGELLARWIPLARALPSLAGWLTERHLRGAIDAFSVDTTEQLLAAAGVVPTRPAVMPSVVFFDLTGFTRATQMLGDEAAAGLSLRLGELAGDVASAVGGRLVKLLGDGALLKLPDARIAVDASLDLMIALGPAGLPGGHAGVHCGALIERDGDIFGRTVNIAARISDAAPDGAIYVTADVIAQLAGSDHRIERIGAIALQSIGDVELWSVARPG